MFIPSGAGAITVSDGPFGGFELDGNQVPSEIAPGNLLDWNSASVRQTVVPVRDDFADSGFTQGSKELEPKKWFCSTGGNDPVKGDILRAYINQRTFGTGLYLDLGWVRTDGSGDGDVHLNFEFNQGPQTPAAPLPGSCALNRLDGDLLVTYDFPGGTSDPIVKAYTWDRSKAKGNDEGDWVESILDSGTGGGAVYTGTATIQDFLAGTTPESVGPRRFGEATLDLGAILARTNPGVCSAFYTANVRSRASGESWTSALQDKLPSTTVNFSNCGQIQIEKRSDDDAPLSGAEFQVLSGSASGPVAGTCTTVAGFCTVSNLMPGANYYVKETAAPAGHTGITDPLGPFTVSPGATVKVPVENIRWRYHLTLTPAEDTNLVDNDHVFVAALTKSIDGGVTFAPAGTERISFGLAGIGAITGIDPSDPVGGSCLTSAAGTCTVTIRSSAPGDSTLSAIYDNQVVSTGVEATASAVKHWHDYRIEVTPSGHTNEVGKNHTFTVTLERATDGANWAPVAGKNPVVTDVSGPGTITGGTCGTTGTDAAGQCTVVLSSATAGTDTISASYHAVVSGTSKTFTTSAVKNWVDYALAVNPDGLHRAGESHTFTAVLTRNTGSGFAPFAGQTVNLAWNGTNGSSLAGPSCVTAADGTCSIVANSALAANGEVTASWSDTLDSGAVSRTDNAVARWVDWALTVGPANATNLIGTNHTFRITLTKDEGLGAGPVAVVGAKPATVLTGVAHSVVSNSCQTSGTNAAGVCTVVIRSAVPGSNHLAVSYQGVDGTATENLSGAADKLWVSYALTVVDDGVARAGTEQSYTVTVTTDDGPGDPVAVPNAVVALSWNGPAGSGIVSVTPAGPGPGSCTTNGSGRCTVIVNSPDPAAGELTGTYSFDLDSGVGSVSDSAGKRWVDWAITLTPAEAENLTDTDHTFVVTLAGDSGEGDGVQPIAGANPVFTLQGKGQIVSDGCDTDGTDADGQCEVVVHSDSPGDSFASVSWTGEDAGATGTVSDTAFKHWITYRLNVTPETSTGPVGTTHQWLVHLEVDHGEGFGNAGNEDIVLAVTGVGSVTGVDAGNATSCVTDTAGACRVNVTSPTPGDTTLLATYHAVVGPTSRDLTDSGVRTWTDIPVTPVEPDSDPEIGGSHDEKPVPAVPVQPAAPAPVIPIVAAPIPEPPVVAAAPVATLPVTGAGAASAVRVAFGFLAAGLALIAAGRRRQQDAS